jgi:hypothetical protein
MMSGSMQSACSLIYSREAYVDRRVEKVTLWFRVTGPLVCKVCIRKQAKSNTATQ